MNYTQFVDRISTLTENNETGVDFTTILPQAIDYAEQRIYRELNLAANVIRNSTNRLTAGAHTLRLNTNPFITIEAISVIVPATATTPDSATRSPLTPTSWDFIDTVYPSAASASLPSYYALINPSLIAFGPWPDQPYVIEIRGTMRPDPLSAINPTTTLSVYFPDILVTAAMIFMSGYMRNYGAQSDDPQQGVTWEGQYNKLLQSAQAEELRKRYGVMP